MSRENKPGTQYNNGMVSKNNGPGSKVAAIAILLMVLAANMAGGRLSAGHGAIAAPSGAAPEGFAHPAIKAKWEQDEQGAASGQRSWMWGPGPFYTNYEPFMGLPQGNHLVQYFDKGRLEVNDPAGDPKSPWFVTSGLLVREMVAGKAQVGDRQTLDLGPAEVPVLGNISQDPTYAHFSRPPHSERSSDATGSIVGCWFTPGGRKPVLDPDLTLARYEQATGHNWAKQFWSFANGALGGRWLQILGYPITEPCAVETNIAGKSQYVLMQLFERRVLTYNPANPAASQVEMGNVGRHYYNWRYANTKPASLNSKYNVKIAIGPAPRRTTQVQQTVELTNGTGRPLGNVVLRVVWRHWNGAFTLRSAAVDGVAAETRWLHGINLEVALPKAATANGKVTLNLAFELQPRPIGGRNGYDRANDILSLGDMLPTVVPWENGGWSYYPYSELGDLGYYDTSDYSVEIASAGREKLVVGGTGQIVSSSTDGTNWKFSAPRVRDVAYVVSPRFVNPLEDAGMRRQEGKVRMLGYFLPERKREGQRQLELTGPALSWFSNTIGAYPFDTYMVAEMGVPLERTDNYAQEYPMAYFIPSPWLSYGTSPGDWTWYIPVHEVGHQWFYSTVGNNQLTNPWLDEALTTYVTAEYVRINHPASYARAWDAMTRGANRSKPVSSGVFSGFANENEYSNTIYNSGALMLNRVRMAMGDAAFYVALRDYYSTYAFKRATPANLLQTLQKHSQADLKPIFAEYLGY